MDFDFSDEQKMLRDEAQRFLSEVVTFARVRRHLDSGDSFDRELWAQLGEMGWLGTSIGEAQGGLGFGPLEVCVLVEALGKVLAPVPFFSTVCIGAEILKGSDADIAGELLATIASGQAAVTLASAEGGRDWHWTLSTRYGGGSVHGIKSPVPDLLAADRIIVTALDDAGTPQLLLVDANAAGVERRPLEGLDALRPHGELTLSNAPAQVLASGENAKNLLTTVLNQAAVFSAFEQVGGSQGALDMALSYTGQRYAFGRTLSSNQAVKHKLADLLVKLELARSNAYYGAWAIEAGSEELPGAAAAARLSATDAFESAAEENLHLHGGIGYTWEADCQFYYRRARLLAVSLGNAAAWGERMLASLGRSH